MKLPSLPWQRTALTDQLQLLPLLLLFPTFLLTQSAMAQSQKPATSTRIGSNTSADRPDDNEYYQTFDEQLTARLYLARKYTSLFFDAPNQISSLRYRPNTLVNLGVNGSYKALSLSLSSGFQFLNPNASDRGKTKSFDFQTHFYPRDWVTDIYLQFYKGYYLSLGTPPGTRDKQYETRPDIRARLVGLAVYRLLNGKNFSYRAGFQQSEWQKKSAGSVLFGAGIYYGSVKGDSALVPHRLDAYYPQAGIHRFRLLEFGPGIGYAYTYVYQEHLFVTGSVNLNTDFSFVKEEGVAGAANRSSFSPNATLRTIGGYNSERWAFTIAWLHNTTNAKGRSSDYEYSVRTGDFRVTLARRFTPGSRLKRQLDGVIQRIP